MQTVNASQEARRVRAVLPQSTSQMSKMHRRNVDKANGKRAMCSSHCEPCANTRFRNATYANSMDCGPWPSYVLFRRGFIVGYASSTCKPNVVDETSYGVPYMWHMCALAEYNSFELFGDCS